MNVMEWMLWTILETVKIILIVHGIFGFAVSKSKWKYTSFLWLIINVLMCVYAESASILLRTLWGFLFIMTFFEGKMAKKLQCYILEVILVSIIDLLLWSVFIVMFQINIEPGWINIVSESLGLAFWFVLSCALVKMRKKINQVFLQLSFWHYLMIIVILLGLGVIGGSVQYSLLENTPESIRKFSLLMEMIVTLMVVSGCIAFMYTLYAKKCAEMINEINEERLVFQKKYYETIIKKNEGIRQIRHDMRKHMGAIKALCDNDRIEEVKQYVEELSDAYQENEMIYTGNIVSDYFINLTINELKKETDLELEYYITGRFPEKMNISNNDLCIVLANALENVQHAFKRKKGKCRLIVNIKNYKERIYIYIANSALSDEISNMESGKRNGHGYGIFNIKQVVEKYNGEIEFNYADDMFAVKICMNQ